GFGRLGGLSGRCRLSGGRSGGSRRLRLRQAHAGVQNDGGRGGQTESDDLLSAQGLFSSIFCMILISARCVLSASVAKLNRSASWPAPGASNKSFTITSAPLWCWIIPVK